jgi:hypothetical protein
MRSQGLWGRRLGTPEEVVGRLGAVQAQEYHYAKWTVAQRANGADEATIDRGLADGSILRTHLLRPTWHFVLPRDIRWMLALTGPRVKARNASRLRDLGLDERLLSRSNGVMARAVEGGSHLTRKELAEHLARARIVVTGQRLPYLLMGAELDGVICSGAPRGKQQTYALLDERAPKTRELDRDEALAELVRRFFTARGPATLRDFARWSSLTVADAKRGLGALAGELEHREIAGRTYWFAPRPGPWGARSTTIDLVQGYDEIIMSYSESRDVLHGSASRQMMDGSNSPMHAVLLDGQLIGRWRRTVLRNSVVLDTTLDRRLDDGEARALETAAKRYARFVGMPTTLALDV